MNRIYKVIWNEALSCFTAVGEYAKGRGKSSKSSVNSNATINTTSNLASVNKLRLSAIGLGLLAAGFGMQTNATGTDNHHEGNYSHSHGSHGVHSHSPGNNSHNNNSNSGGSGGSIALKFEGDNATTITRSDGETLNILGGATGPLTNGNIGVFGTGDTLTIKLAQNIDLGADGSLKTGDTLVDNSGIKITASSVANNVVLSSSGLNNGNNKVINVANGLINASSKDAVNGSQLHSLTNTVAANKTKYYSVNSTATGNANNDGATGPNAMAMGGNATATGGQAIAIGSGESGQNTVASGQQSIAIGANVVSKGASSIAIGGDDLDDASKANINGTSASTLNGGDVNTTFFSYTGRDLVETPRYKVNTESGGAASIAIGAKSLSEGALSTAIGIQSSSSGVASSAFGIGASASEKGSVALGAGSVANVAGGADGYVPTGASMGATTAITATQSGADYGAVSVGSSIEGGARQIVNVAAGSQDSDAVNVAQLKALDTIVAGIDFPIRSSSTQPYTTSVTGIDALAVGSNANANGDSSTAVGENAFANGIQASAFGAGAEATARSSLASGFEAKAKGGESVALGVKSSADGLGATAVGPTASARGEDSAALGRRSRADGDGALALGGFSKAVGANASAVGFKAEATNKNATAIGVNAKALGERSVALGEGAQATTLTGTAIGSRTLASAVQSTAVGVGSKATKQWATAMGFSSEANGVSSVALGDRSVVDGKESIAIGKGNTVSGANSIAIGTENDVTGNNSGAFGDPNTITGSGSYVMGNDNTVGNDNTFVLGNEVKTTQDNSIVLGNLSTDRAATTETGIIINGTPYTYAGSAPVGVMSVGSVGNERQIINVAAGAVNATSTDAVNGSQLHATNEAVESNTTTINKGFGLKAADGYVVQKSLGQAVEVVGSNDNIDTRVRNGKIEVKLNNDLDLGSNGSISTGNIFSGTQVNRLGMVTGGLAMGGVTTVSGLGVTVTGTNPLSNATLTSDGLSMFNGPSITKSNGINAGNKKVTNVKAGVLDKDAVNVSQL
ncbi:ESPR-type extended signal peptide-containing protein, partial [Psychrobacter namhaensis]